MRILNLASVIFLASIPLAATGSDFAPSQFTDPFPVPAAWGTPAQDPGSIVAYESFETVKESGPGILGQAWYVSANTIDTIPIVHALPGNLQSGMPALSVEFWAKFNPAQLPVGTLVHGPGWKVAFSNDGTTVALNIQIHQSKQGVWCGRIGRDFLNVGPADNQWHQYVITFDCRTFAVYIDGAVNLREWEGNNSDAVGPVTDGFNLPDVNDIEIGGQLFPLPDAQLRYPAIDELRISSVALSPWQVMKNFENYRNPKIVIVSPNGADSAPGTSANPTSLKSAMGTASPGQKIILLPGTYSGSDFQLLSSGMSPQTACVVLGQPAADPVIINVPSAPAQAPTVNGEYIILRNLTFSATDQTALSIKSPGPVLVDACRIASQVTALSIDSSSNITIQNCLMKAGTGISFLNSPNCIALNNTVVGGNTGVSFGGNSPNPSVVNNLISGQASTCLSFSQGSLFNIVGDGNVYDPLPGGMAAILGGTAYSRDQLDAYRHQLYLIDYPNDSVLKLTAFGPENNSIALSIPFVDQSSGDYRVPLASGNPIDTGVTSTFLRQIDPAFYDLNGSSRPQGNTVDSGAFEAAGPVQATFSLANAGMTSAGAYTSDGTLLRTLWSGKLYPAGQVTAYWNGLDDRGIPVSNGNYQIKMITHNVSYMWDGVIGNTSTFLNGPLVHNAFFPIQSIAIAGTRAYYCTGYNESQITFFLFDTTHPQQLVTKIGNPDYERSFNYAATDGQRVYFADNSSIGLVVAYNIVDNSTFVFQNSTQFNNYSGIPVGTQAGVSGLAVSTNQNFLFVPHATDNKLYVFDKTSGAALSTIDLSTYSITQPSRIAADFNGGAWLDCTRQIGNVATQVVVHFSGFAGIPVIDQMITNVSAPAAVAVSPVDGNILVADGGSSHQLKLFNPSGNIIWTYGQLGGYTSNGPAVTNDKFLFHLTFIAFQPDGSFWFRDEGTHRSIHLSAQRQFIELIQYIPHNYQQATDPNNPTRVFNNYLEFQVDYSKPLNQGGWKLVNYWGYNLPPNTFDDLSVGAGLQRVCTLDGHTFAILQNSSTNSLRPLAELLPTGLRYFSLLNFNFDFGFEGDGALTRMERPTGTSVGNFYKSPYTGLDASNNPTWGPEVIVASVPEPWSFAAHTVGDRWNGYEPLQDSGNWRSTSGGLVISYEGDRHSAGFHLGAIRPGSNAFLWKASPSGAMDGLGTFDTNVEYDGFEHMASGHNILFQLHGEFWHDGQANQFFHYYDNGLFVGQFGQPAVQGIGTDMFQSRVPGLAGNSFSPSVVNVNGELYMYHNDESGHGGSHRWHVTGAQSIQELVSGSLSLPIVPAPSGSVNSGGSPLGSNVPPPVIMGGITAANDNNTQTNTPQPIVVPALQPVALTVTAMDPSGMPLTFVWDFGDSTQETGVSTVSHIYDIPGTYTATVTVSNGATSTESSVTVTVLGTPMTLSRIQGAAKFNVTGQDSISVAGLISQVPAAYNPAGSSVIVIVAGTITTFLLQKSGKGTVTQNSGAIQSRSAGLTASFSLKIKKPHISKSHPAPGDNSASFTLLLKGENIGNYLTANGINPKVDSKNTPFPVSTFLTVGQTVYENTTNVKFTGKANKGGMFKK